MQKKKELCLKLSPVGPATAELKSKKTVFKAAEPKNKKTEETKNEDQELDFVVLGSGLLITPEKKVRIGWDNKNEHELTANWEWSKS